jgi:arabinose-5-phosphate isomerase
MVCSNDVIILISNSGETAELSGIIRFAKRFKVPIVGITAGDDSTLARNADICMRVPSVAEACPNNLAPTSSTMIQLAIGDALSISLLKARGFTPADFRTFHPGGKLGAQLTPVRDIMHMGKKLPLSPRGTIMQEAILTMTEKGFGCLGVVDQAGVLSGIITDGDLRRHMGQSLMDQTVEAVMTKAPKTITPETLADEALERMNSSAVTALFVVDNDIPVGIVHLHDLLRVGTA